MKPPAPEAMQPEGNGGRTALAGAPVSFRHGVASGDPLADRVVLWTRVTVADAPNMRVVYKVAHDPFMSAIVSYGEVVVGAATDFVAKIDVVGLAPATTYYYQFEAAGARSPVGRTRTLPVGAVECLRIGVVSCSSFTRGYFNAYRHLARRNDLDCVLHLGDYIYEYAGDELSDVRAHEPAAEIHTLEDYRTRHAQYKTDADLQELHRQHPMISMWDDHETADGARRDGADNHDAATQGPWRVRVANALRAYHEWMPTRLADPARPEKYYRDFKFGDLARLIMLEERLGHRDIPNNAAASSAQLLGIEQERWLAAQLHKRDVQWRIIGQGVMMSQLRLVSVANGAGGSRYLNSDQWDGYAPARDRFFNMLAGVGHHGRAENVVVLSGDVHSSWASDLTPDPGNRDVSRGGYDPATGAGSLAVEFTTTSVTSLGLPGLPGITELALSINPQFKYANVVDRGYLLLDIDANRVGAEWWYVDDVRHPAANERFGAAFQVRSGTNRVEPGSVSLSRFDATPLAPG